MVKDRIDYGGAGVKYSDIDPLKLYGQRQARETAKNLERLGFEEVRESRGESAYVFNMGEMYGAMVVEGLGTKALILTEYPETEEFWEAIARDAVATIANDLSTVGASPAVISPHWAAGSSEWFSNRVRWRGLIAGWAGACNEIGASYGAGETSVLVGVVDPATVELSGAGFGVIKDKRHLILGERLAAGDEIILIASSGIHANGLTLARKLVKERIGYDEKLGDGRSYGEALLSPTVLYSPLIDELNKRGLTPHYVVNITGHGWRKLMRASRDLIYHIQNLPSAQEEFGLIQEVAELSDQEMYETFNMGAGYALMVDPGQTEEVIRIAGGMGYEAIRAGEVLEGKKQVVIEPLGISYSGESLQIR
jgi:phosphoribosylformylglycinamidine cyclo-ligase